ncbi:MAG: ParB/RepB/Spo0J family partition protein [Dehalococcoidia bacterium]|nr:ParB/RepB/Spo0J family partition protein [Dehalococcoidia bacterium]
MTQPKRGLGRGLDALFGGGVAAPPPPPVQQQPAPPPAESAPEPAPPPVAAPPVEEPAAREQPPAAAEAVRAPQPETVAPEAPAARVAPEPAPPATPAARVAPEPAVAAQASPPAPAAPARAASPAPAVAEVPRPVRRGGPEYLDLDVIAPNPEQPRTHFEPEKLRELADSIREHGIIQPLIVSRDEAGGVRLIAGERRLQAARLAGLETVPVVFHEAADDTELLELALIENIQRADLNPIEEALAYRRLTDEYALTQEECARRVGKSRAAVANSLRLLQLEPEIRRSLVAGEITEGHARALLGLPDSKLRMNAWREVIKKRMSVRDVEAHVRRAIAATPPTPGLAGSGGGSAAARRDALYADIEARLRRALSTRVMVQPQKRGARITIECYSSEEFEQVLDRILGEEDDE